jgi:hypothetical protein
MDLPSDEVGRKLPRGFYWRGQVIWFRYKDVAGEWQSATSGTAEIEEAKRVRRRVQGKVADARNAGVTDTGPQTFERYSVGNWLPRAVEHDKAYASFHRVNLAHALKHIGRLALEEVRPYHLFDMVRDLQAQRLESGEARFASRTILHVYGTVRVIFRDAVRRGLVEITPCTLSARLGELPEMHDKDPEWRETAVYTKEEVVALISDPSVPLYRRVSYAMLFLLGIRAGEFVVRRWRDWDPTAKPLGRMMVATAPHRARKGGLKGVKSGFARKHPVHPVLASILAEWKLSGWAQTYGRPPTAEDFIVGRASSRQIAPSGDGPIVVHRFNSKRPWQWLNGYSRKGRAGAASSHTPGDLERLGLRRRRAHDARRTLISLTQADGGRGEVLEYITHGPTKKQAFSLYTTWPWETQCEEVAKLKIAVRKRKAV